MKRTLWLLIALLLCAAAFTGARAEEEEPAIRESAHPYPNNADIIYYYEYPSPAAHLRAMVLSFT